MAAEDNGLMGELKRAHQITSACWRAAIAALGAEDIDGSELEHGKSLTRSVRDCLTPEEAAETLSVRVQTMRSYIRSGRLPAFRLAARGYPSQFGEKGTTAACVVSDPCDWPAWPVYGRRLKADG